MALAPSPVPIDFEAPVGCSSADAFYAAVAARLDRAHLVRAAQAGMRLGIRLTRSPARVHGELRLSDGRGGAETRKVDGTTCDEVADVLALTTALALDPASSGGARPAPPASTTATP